MIVSTNIAETSVTIRGIKHVIDTGMVKAKYVDSIVFYDNLNGQFKVLFFNLFLLRFFFFRLSHQRSPQWIIHTLRANTQSSLAPTSHMSPFTTYRYLLFGRPLFSFPWRLHLQHLSVHIVFFPTFYMIVPCHSLFKPVHFQCPSDVLIPNLVLCYSPGNP